MNEPCGSVGDKTEGREVAILEWGNKVGYVGGCRCNRIGEGRRVG